MGPKKRPRDVNQLAAMLVAEATEEDADAPSDRKRGDSEAGDSDKNPAAVALGRIGGLKGGKARASALSSERRREIAQLAAAARWKKSD
jgi:hypothetical protein